MDRAAAIRWAAIGVTTPVAPVPINVTAGRIGGTDHKHPIARTERVLEIAADAQTTLGIECVEADPVWPRRILRCAVAVVEAKRPFLLTHIARAFTLSKPMDVARSFRARKVQRVGSDPGRDGEFTRGGDAVV